MKRQSARVKEAEDRKKAKRDAEQEEQKQSQFELCLPPHVQASQWFASKHAFLSQFSCPGAAPVGPADAAHASAGIRIAISEPSHTDMPQELKGTLFAVEAYAAQAHGGAVPPPPANAAEAPAVKPEQCSDSAATVTETCVDRVMVVFLRLGKEVTQTHMCSPKIVTQVLWPYQLQELAGPNSVCSAYMDFWRGLPNDCHLLVTTKPAADLSDAAGIPASAAAADSSGPAHNWYYLGLATRSSYCSAMRPLTQQQWRRRLASVGRSAHAGGVKEEGAALPLPLDHDGVNSDVRPHYVATVTFSIDRLDKHAMADLDAHSAFSPVCAKCQINRYGASLCKCGDYC